MSVSNVNEFLEYYSEALKQDSLAVLADFDADNQREDQLKGLIKTNSSRAVNEPLSETVDAEMGEFYMHNPDADLDAPDDLKFLWTLWWLVYKKTVEKKDIA